MSINELKVSFWEESNNDLKLSDLKEELKSKVKVLIINNHNNVGNIRLDDYLKIFNFELDFDFSERDFEDKVIYDFELNEKGIKKLKLLQEYIAIKSIINDKLLQKFDYIKTNNSIGRYNEVQDNKELKVQFANISDLWNIISDLKWKISWKELDRLVELEDTFTLENKKEIKFNENNKSYERVLEVFVSFSPEELGDMDILDYIKGKDINLHTELKNKSKSFNSDLKYSLEIKKDKDLKPYQIEEEIKEPSIFSELKKYRKVAVAIIWIGVALLVDQYSNKGNNKSVNSYNPSSILSNDIVIELTKEEAILMNFNNSMESFVKWLSQASLQELYNEETRNNTMKLLLNTFNNANLELFFESLKGENIIDNNYKSISVNWDFDINKEFNIASLNLVITINWKKYNRNFDIKLWDANQVIDKPYKEKYNVVLDYINSIYSITENVWKDWYTDRVYKLIENNIDDLKESLWTRNISFIKFDGEWKNETSYMFVIDWDKFFYIYK